MTAILASPLLDILANTVDDLEKARIATENRVRALTDTTDRGFGLGLTHPDVVRMTAILDALKAQEHQAVLNMRRTLRAHPLWGWAEPIAGVGEKQFARLLAVIGDPYWNDLHERPRTMRELRAYCGWHVIETSTGGSADKSDGGSNVTSVGVAPRRRRGEKGNWNDEARKRSWLIAESLMKQKSVYREVYEAERARVVDSLHPAECVRCGPRGKPAPVGSPRSLGHQNQMALRKVASRFLGDLWIEARRLHGEAPGDSSDGEAQAA